ncbi:SecDF P1 head subdomain-containing protein [Pedobacter sp. NJ-S-72]
MSNLLKRLTLTVLIFTTSALSLAGQPKAQQAQSTKKIPSGIYLAVKKSAYAFKDNSTNKIFYVNPVPVISVHEIEKVTVLKDSSSQGTSLDIALNPSGTKKLEEVTAVNVGKYMPVIINNRLLSAPRLVMPIAVSSLRITGAFTIADAENYKVLLEKEMKRAKPLIRRKEGE